MKRRIFWSVFFIVFFRRPIYESIAAIFWQSASYVFDIFYSFDPNHAYWNQRRLFSGNLPGMFVFFNQILRFTFLF